MNDTVTPLAPAQTATSFFARPAVEISEIQIGPGIPLGIERVSHTALGIAGAYGAWGHAYDNSALPDFLATRVGRPLSDSEKLNLAELGFTSRHHLPKLSQAEHMDLEISVGARLLAEAAHLNGWEPADVDAVLLGMTAPCVLDYTERIAKAAGIRDDALKVSIHKACDGSVAGLNLALNPGLSLAPARERSLADDLLGKRVLVGGLEGLSRVLRDSNDVQAQQLFGTGAGIIGLVPGQTVKFLVGGTLEAYDAEGVLQVHMYYPHSGQRGAGQSMLEITQTGPQNLRVAGLQHEPQDAAQPVSMAGPMGMVKLFVRSGVQAVQGVYQAYEKRMSELGTPDKRFAVVIAHHANLKINQLKGKQLAKEGIELPIPWLVSDFGNVSAASNMIAFLRYLRTLRPGDHVLFDGFGAGTYYDVVAVEL
jgi:3-oxoacyl-[acyl-carrier-protein] synthase III